LEDGDLVKAGRLTVSGSAAALLADRYVQRAYLVV
jgi:hypothetical protein